MASEFLDTLLQIAKSSLKVTSSLGYAFEGKRAKVRRDVVESADGARHIFEIVEVRDAVAILPVEKNGDLVLLYNERIPTGGRIIEAVAGLIDPGEDPEIAARRELKEETGYSAETLTKVGVFYTSPGLMTEKIHLYVAQGLTGGKQKLESAEQGLMVFQMPIKRAMKMLDNAPADGVVDMKTALLLQSYFNSGRMPV